MLVAIDKSVFNLIPFPKKLLSLIPAPIVPPELPKPAPNEISPVGFSTTERFIIFWLSLEPAKTSVSTLAKILLDLMLFIDSALSDKHKRLELTFIPDYRDFAFTKSELNLLRNEVIDEHTWE